MTAFAKAAEFMPRRPPRVRIKSSARTSAQSPVITTITVAVGAGMLRSWLVEKKPLPEREWFIQIAVLGFLLSLLSETMPKLGKSMSYLTLTAVVFAQSKDLLDELDPKSKKNRRRKALPAADAATPPLNNVVPISRMGRPTRPIPVRRTS